MTVVRLKSKGLLIYSAIALTEQGMTELEQLGKPEIIVVPHPFHVMDLPFYKARYPQIKVLGSKKGEILAGVTVEGDVFTELKDANISASLAPGLKADEVHLRIKLKDGYALCVCDIFAGDNSYEPGIGAAIFKSLLGPKGGGFGIAKIVQWRQIADKPKVKSWVQGLARDAELSMVLVCHGEPLVKDIPARLSKAADVL